MKKKILFVNDEMTMGGVAKILNTFISFIDRDKYEVDVLVLHARGELLKEIPQGIKVIEGTSFFDTVDVPLKECTKENIFHKLRLLFYMKTGLIRNRIVKERKKMLDTHYDIEFSAKEGFCTIFNAFGDSDKKINWVQVDYGESNYSSHHMALMKRALKKIDMNIACSEQVSESFKELFDVERICVIHNLVDEEVIVNKSLKEKTIVKDDKKINLICVARFHPQKAVDRIIKAYAAYKDYYRLVIIGDGALKDELYALAKKLDVFDDIVWMGIRNNPFPDIRESDLLVMPSLYEGYPTLSIESLLSSTPVLATKVAGIEEQMTKKEYGWVVENNYEAVFEKLGELKNSKKLLEEYKKELKNYHYDNSVIMNRYYRIFEE